MTIDVQVTEYKEVVFEWLGNFYYSTLIPPLFVMSFLRLATVFLLRLMFLNCRYFWWTDDLAVSFKRLE